MTMTQDQRKVPSDWPTGLDRYFPLLIAGLLALNAVTLWQFGAGLGDLGLTIAVGVNALGSVTALLVQLNYELDVRGYSHRA